MFITMSFFYVPSTEWRKRTGQWEVRPYHNSCWEPLTYEFNRAGLLWYECQVLSHGPFLTVIALAFFFHSKYFIYCSRQHAHEGSTDIKYWCKQMFRFASFKRCAGIQTERRGKNWFKGLMWCFWTCDTCRAYVHSVLKVSGWSSCRTVIWKVFSLRMTPTPEMSLFEKGSCSDCVKGGHMEASYTASALLAFVLLSTVTGLCNWLQLCKEIWVTVLQ